MTRMNPVERVENCLRNATEWTDIHELALQAHVSAHSFAAIARVYWNGEFRRRRTTIRGRFGIFKEITLYRWMGKKEWL